MEESKPLGQSPDPVGSFPDTPAEKKPPRQRESRPFLWGLGILAGLVLCLLALSFWTPPPEDPCTLRDASGNPLSHRWKVDTQNTKVCLHCGEIQELEGVQVAKLVSTPGRLLVIWSDGSVRVAPTYQSLVYNQDDLSPEISQWQDIVAIDGGISHLVGLTAQGTVVSAGANPDGRCDTQTWKNVTNLATDSFFTAALTQDGTVYFTGADNWEQSQVENWSDVTKICAHKSWIAGLKSDGTVEVAGYLGNHQPNFGNIGWSEIADICAGESMLVGLKKDGSVVVAGAPAALKKQVADWQNVAAIYGGNDVIAAINADGTVRVAGMSDQWETWQEEISRWSDIESLRLNGTVLVGVRTDGTVVSVGLRATQARTVSQWRNVLSVVAEEYHLFALTSDGSLLQCSLLPIDLPLDLSPLLPESTDSANP